MKFLELKLPPVAVFLLCGAIAFGLARALQGWTYSLPACRWLAGAVFAAGAGVGVAGIVAFRQHGTTVDPTRPDKASAVVCTGIYRYTRNPMYLGLLLGLIAWTLFLGNLASLAVLPLYVAYMARFQIRPEERLLRDKFGLPYAEYMARVRRWL